MLNIMKKLALLLVILVSFSCSTDDGSSDNFSFQIVPILSVDIPETLTANDVNQITYSYNTPSTCHSFNDLYYIENGNERTIAVVNLVSETTGGGAACQELTDSIDERSFNLFAPPGFSSMTLNFWQGEDENGTDVYLTVEVPVGIQ